MKKKTDEYKLLLDRYKHAEHEYNVAFGKLDRCKDTEYRAVYDAVVSNLKEMTELRAQISAKERGVTT